MNNYYRSILNDHIKKGLLDAGIASKMEHPLLTGRLREIVLHELLKPMLNDRYSMGTGKVVDYEGVLSKEVDICIYSKNLHPPVFFSANDKLGIFPFESVLGCIEVKSDFSKKNVKDTYDKFLHLNSALTMTSGTHRNDNPQPHIIIKPHYSLFIFQSTIKSYKPESFINVYKKIDPNWDSKPILGHICIAGKGSFFFTNQGWLHMGYDSDKNIHEEVIAFLGTVIHDLPRTEDSRGIPRIGYYLTDTYKMDRIIKGKFHERPWGSDKLAFKSTDVDDAKDVSILGNKKFPEIHKNEEAEQKAR
jgi:hypothetical protein